MATLQGADPDFTDKIMQLISASGGQISLTSGYRDTAHQQRLWDAALQKYGSAAAARKYVAPPGHSNHEKGIAADLSGNLKLAAQLAPRFGLYNPMSWEPWHFEPVGSRGQASQQAYTSPNAGGDANAQAAGQDPHDIGTQLGNFLNILSGVTGDTALEPNINNPDGSPVTSTTAVSGSGAEQLARAAKAAGFTGDSLRRIIAIGFAESKKDDAGNPMASFHNRNAGTGDDSYGFTQINMLGKLKPERLKQFGITDPNQLLDPLTNLKAAHSVSGGGTNFTPWSTYKSGAYQKYLSNADQLIAQLGLQDS